MFGLSIARLACVALLFYAYLPLAGAQVEDSASDAMFEHAGDSFEEYKYREDFVELPNYPVDASLQKVDIDAAYSPFEYFVDTKSISIGADDAVAYTVVIKSSTGASNVLFETIRCDTREYKTHAYGTSKKAFYRMFEPQWKRIIGRGGTGTDYRRDLVTMYFCSERSTLDLNEIQRRIYDSANIPEKDRRF